MAVVQNTTANDNPWLDSPTKIPNIGKKKKKFDRYFDGPKTSISVFPDGSQSSEMQQKRKLDYNEEDDEPIKHSWKDRRKNDNFNPKKEKQLNHSNRKDKIFTPDLRPSKAWKGGLSKPGVKNERQKLFAERVPVAPEKLSRHSRGEGLNLKGVDTGFHAKKLQKREEKIEQAIEQAARTELLLPEDSGYLEPDVGEVTVQYTQKQIAANVDIISATKYFELQLSQFGPYRMNYNRSGRYLLLGGRKGHVAAIDWVTKKLYCEMNVMEEVFDVQWLHVETMFAVAQKNWVYVYDNQGVELHCMRRMNKVLRLEFLPYHFLLATSSEEGFLSWLDISIGKFISVCDTRLGRLNIMTQNPANAVLCLGHTKGIVTMWSPNVQSPLAKILCHRQPVTAISVDHRGQYMATASVDRSLKIWDVRMLEGPLQEYRLRAAATNLAFSQRSMLSVGMGNVVEVYRDCCTQTAEKPYLRHKLGRSVSNFQFCPFEDVLGVASAGGFTSLIIPGAGEPNFDALELNPFQTKSQRRETEVKSLLEKIQPEFITLDPSIIAEVDLPSVKERMAEKLKSMHYKPPAVELEHRKKSKGKKGSAKMALTKKIVREEKRKDLNKLKKQVTEELLGKDSTGEQSQPVGPTSVLDRFKTKKVKK